MSFGNSPLLDSKTIFFDESSASTKFGYLVKRGELRGKPIIVKSLSGINQQVDKLEVAEALLGEAKKLWELDHTFLVKFVGVAVDLNAIAFENVSDLTLFNYIRDVGKMTWAEKLLVSADVACGMHYLHTEILVQKKVKKAEFVHQDLSSSTIILVFENTQARRMRARVSDYGLAGLRRRINNVKDSALKSSVLKSGTSSSSTGDKDNFHLAPEIVFQNSKPTTASDIYSFGTIVLELVTMLPLKDVIIDFSSRIKGNAIPPLFRSVVQGCLHLDEQFRLTFGSIFYFCITQEQVIHRFDADQQGNITKQDEDDSILSEEPPPTVLLSKSLSYITTVEPIIKYRRLEVKRAKWEDVDVSIKTVIVNNNNNNNNNQNTFTALQREAALNFVKKLQACDMHNIAAFIGLVPETYGLVFEFMSEGSLERFISKTTNITWQQRMYFAYEISEAMSYLHSHFKSDGSSKISLVHQDLTSANCLLYKENGQLRIKICDSAIRDLFRILSPYKPVDPINAPYTPPEHQKANFPFSKKSDVYCFAVILCELTVLQSAQSSLNMIKMHLKSKPVPVVMKYLIEKCMHSNPKERMDFDTIKLYLYMTDTSYIPLSSTSGMTAGGASVLSSKSNSSDGNNTIPQSGSNFTKPNNFSNSNSSLVTAAASATARTQRSGNAHTNTTNKKLPNANHNYTGIVSGFNIDMRSVLFAEYEPINNMSVLSERGFEMTNMNNNDGVGNNRVNRFRPLQETSYQDESGTRSKKRNDRRVSPQTKKRILLIFSVIVAACLIVAIALGILFGLKPGSSPAKNNGSSNGDSTVNYIPWAQDQLFGGANTYFIQNLPELDQDEAISILAAANIKVIRTIITATPARYLNSTSLEIYDVEWPECGVYNDTILSRLDRVMWKAYESGMKLIIAFHNRDNLGCEFSDVYVDQLNLSVTSKDQGDNSTNPCFHQPNNPFHFYNNATAIGVFQERIHHILNHKNPYFSNRPWHNISEAIFSFDIQHKNQAFSSPRNEDWTCVMASAVKSILSSPTIQVSTGGGADLTDSVAPSNFRCQWVDIVSLNAQYFNEYYIMDQLTIAKTLSSQYDKPLVLNVFGALSVRPKFFSRVMKFCQSINMSWIMWAFVKPGDNRNRMEFYNQDSHTMQVISSRALEIWTNASSTNWIEYELPHGLAPNTIIDWKNCEDSYQCLYTIEKTSCCTNIYSSSDGVAKW